MLEFKTSPNGAGATAGTSLTSAAYKVVPERSTSAISSGLDRLFDTPTSNRMLSREASASGVPGQGREWEASAAEKRYKARALESVHRELDEYLNDPLETFSRTERVDGIERRVVFDLLAFWQACALFPSPFGDTNFTAGCRKEIPKSLSTRYGCSPRPGQFSAMRASLLIWEGDLHRSSQQNPAEAHGSPPGPEAVGSQQHP